MTQDIIRPECKYLWKYLDIFKLIHFLKKKQFHFSALNEFEDIMEGVSEHKAVWMKNNHRTASIVPSHRNKGLSDSVYEDSGRIVLNIHEDLKYFQRLFYVNCFYASDSESDLMWNLYTQLQGVAIRFDANKLFDFFKEYHNETMKDNYHFYARPIDYKDLASLEIYDDKGDIKNLSIDHSAFVKNEAFRHENEYRFMFVANNDKQSRPDVKISDWSALEFSVIASPDLEEWKRELIEDLIKEYTPLNIEVSSSDIITRKTLAKYKEAYLELLIKRRGAL